MNNVLIKEIAKRLVDIRAEILDLYPFFGRLLMRLPFGFDKCETAYTDMRHIVFDPDFANRLSKEQLKFVALHEIMHCVLKHCTRGKGKLQLHYNIACDIVVNSILLDALSVNEFEVAGQSVMHLTPNGKEGREYTAEQVYEMLISNEEDYGLYLSFDTHENWKGIPSNEFNNELWDKYIKEASKGSGLGSGIPSLIKRMVDDTNRLSKISWKQILHDFLQSCENDYLFSPPDKRYSDGFLLPSFQENAGGTKIDNVWFVIDTSGSVSDFAISQAFSEIKDAVSQLENISGYVSFFDCEITEPEEFSSIDDIENMSAFGGGGTSFEAIFDYLNDNLSNDLPRVIIIITDGQANFPEEKEALGVPVFWIIVDSDVEPPWGEQVHIYS